MRNSPHRTPKAAARALRAAILLFVLYTALLIAGQLRVAWQLPPTPQSPKSSTTTTTSEWIKRLEREANEAAVRATVPDLSSSATSPPPTTPPLKIAVAVTVTRDGPYLDGAAVLQHSVRMTNSRHNLEMIAIVHAGVTTTRPALQSLGFKILEFPPPITSAEIQGQHLRETIDKSGCCGALELLKLCAWKLVEYDRVLVMDMDAILLQNLDEEFERELPPGGLMFTNDWAMDNRGSRAPPVQGGFLLVRPSPPIYDRLIEIVRVGDFRPSTGWGGTGIGWCWGGQTVQGLLAYFYNLIDTSLAFPLDECLYDAMVSTEKCRPTPLDRVKSIHYTVCQKPWECRTGDNPLCARFLHAWWLVRQDLERAQGFTRPRGRCCRRGKYCVERSYTKLEVEKMRALPMVNYGIVSSSAFSATSGNKRSGLIVEVPSDLDG